MVAELERRVGAAHQRVVNALGAARRDTTGDERADAQRSLDSALVDVGPPQIELVGMGVLRLGFDFITFQAVPITAEGRLVLSVALRSDLGPLVEPVVRLVVEDGRVSLWSEEEWRAGRVERLKLLDEVLSPG